jgi:hypothetical protein
MTSTFGRRTLRRLLIVALPALAVPAGADATPAACASVSTTDVVDVDTGSDCVSQTGDAGHIVGAQVCSSPGSSGGNAGLTPDLANGGASIALDPASGVAWVDASGSATTQQGGVTAGSGSTAVGAGDDVGTQCAP